MGLEGYTGPTSGRITVGGDGPSQIERFYDPPLTRDERNAVADWLALSPPEQAREVRRLRWNLAEMTRQRDTQRDIVRRQDTELLALRAKLATFTPEGYQLPPAAADLLADAQAHGWKTAKAWVPAADGMDEPRWTPPDGYRLEIIIGLGLYAFKLSWYCTPDGRGHMIRRGLARAPRRDWHDAPSLLKIKEIIGKVKIEDE